MNWSVLAGGALVLVTVAVFLYWQLNLAEGAYLGRRAVIFLYDRFAPRYDHVKQFDENDEAWFLGIPLAQALQGVATSLVLDVATGTGRLPLALLRQPSFTGRIIALDLSRQMLCYAAKKTDAYQNRLTLLWQEATQLPFPNATFDAVTCLEALEFLPDSRATLAEMARVLRPGGLFLASNRIGPGLRWMPGRTMQRPTLTVLLESLCLRDIRFAVWQVDYDIVWARKQLTEPATKPGGVSCAVRSTIPTLLRCPRCANTPLERMDNALTCQACHARYPIADDGVVEMVF